MKTTIFFLAIVSTLISCGTTAHIENSWRNPEVSVDVTRLNKVLIVALLKDETNRRAAEDQMATLLPGKAIASYNYFPKNISTENEESIQEKIKDDGFDGIVIMRLADVEKDIQYVHNSTYPYPGYYRRFWGYYWNAWNAFYDPGYYRTTKTYTVETNVYSLKRDQLIWSSTTSSVDPANVQKLMNASANVVFKEMKKQGFLQGV